MQVGASANGQPVPLGTFPVNSVVAKILGAQPLDAEDLTNYTAGLVWSPGSRFALTLDFYRST
jgi:iron complex outermembrane receptor protein